MPQKGKNIYQRKDGRWEGRYIKGRTEAGKAVYGYVYAHTYEEVTKKRDEAEDGVDPEKLKKNVPKKDSAEAVAIEWLYSLKPQIKKSTFCKYHTLVYSYIIPELGQKISMTFLSWIFRISVIISSPLPKPGQSRYPQKQYPIPCRS